MLVLMTMRRTRETVMLGLLCLSGWKNTVIMKICTQGRYKYMHSGAGAISCTKFFNNLLKDTRFKSSPKLIFKILVLAI